MCSGSVVSNFSAADVVEVPAIESWCWMRLTAEVFVDMIIYDPFSIILDIIVDYRVP